ncbi:MAG: hypothetical protein C4541_02530 [Candidatus Auribacter fodinae]|jgi:flagellar basal-body rod modification protein FlgD|uniref:Basal-body rod modification protein FlgD n=1 Tax=Candidatus Auribacter fodinae TaxID=2093366 RepID=A0A3A4REK5_9BACT|nr:MAG: hypothetical protein C4541_02530 [Candidatus Auribacter fodinae]
MSISATQSTSTQESSSSSKLFSSESSNLGKDDFLNLFVAQLANQDPMEPLSNEEFIAQMATFSQLEQLTNLNSSFESFARGQILSGSSGLIGKTVTAIDGSGDEQSEVTGVVNAVLYKNGKALVAIGDKEISINNITEING